MHTGQLKQSVNILLVGVQASIRQGLGRVMELNDGWSICGHAENLPRAMELTQSLKPDIIVMGIGLSTVRDLIAIDALAGLHPRAIIVGLSVQTDESLVTRLKRAGMVDVVDQRLAYDTIVPTLQQVLVKHGKA